MKPNYRYYIYVSVAAIFIVVFLLMVQPPKVITTGVVHQPKTTTLFFGGDIMLSRNVGIKLRASGDNALPFENIYDDIKNNDINFANLESPYSDQGPIPTAEFTFKAEPDTIDGLIKAKFNVLSTANNHSLDQGTYGLNFTPQWLTEHNIVPVGSGTNCHQGVIVTKNGMKFGFLAYTYGTNVGQITSSLCYTTDLAQLTEDVTVLRPKVDYLIVSAHMGVEYTRRPTQTQINFAHAAIDAGADLMIGNHPHWVQTTESYKGKWIFYAMGNLVFDQMFSVDTTQGLTATFTFKDKVLKKIQLRPIVIENFCCPRWANSDEEKTILKNIDLTSPTLLDNN